MGDDPKPRRYPPQGPFSPPTPAEADQTEGEPMAVAGDKANLHGESFVATTASSDAMDADVARRYRDPNLGAARSEPGKATPHGRDVSQRSDENRRMESPPGYTAPDAKGRSHLKDETETDLEEG